MTWASLHPLFLFSWWAMKPMWLVRWILLLPPRARLGRKITRMPDNHSRATAFSSCTPLFSFPPWWRQPPRPHDWLCCKQHTCWLHSPSGPAPCLAQLSEQKCRSVYNLGTQSRSYSSCGLHFTLARWGKEEWWLCSPLVTADTKVTTITRLIRVSLFPLQVKQFLGMLQDGFAVCLSTCRWLIRRILPGFPYITSPQLHSIHKQSSRCLVIEVTGPLTYY